VLWLKEGDKCTKFFLRMVNSNGRNNSIESLVVNDSVSTNHAEIREHIVQFYDNLFTEQFSWRPRLDGHIFDWIEGGGGHLVGEAVRGRRGLHGGESP